jgi:CHAT domain-containing protein
MRRALRRALLAAVLALTSGFAPRARQLPSAQTDFERDFRAAERLATNGKSAEAAAAFRAIADAARAGGFGAEEGRAQCGLGDALSEQAQYTQALPPLHRCLELAEQLGNDRGAGQALLLLSFAAEVNGQKTAAAEFADRAVAIAERLDDPLGRARARSQLLRVRDFTDTEEEAIQRQIIEDARRAGERGLEAQALHSWGDHLFMAGRFDEAFEKLMRARGLWEETGNVNALGTTYNSIGRVYRAHGRIDEALKYQRMALAIHEKSGAPFELMQSLNAVAVVSGLAGDLTGSLDHYQRALAIARHSSSMRIQDFLRANIAGLLMQQGEYESAARTFEEVIARGLDTYPGLRYSNLSLAYLKLHRTADALAAAQKAVAACSDNQGECLVALEARAAAYDAANNDDAARADLRKALDTIEALRARLVPDDFLKQNFHEARLSVYSALIAIAFNHRDSRESLNAAELASSRAFLDLLAGRNASPESVSPAESMTLRGAPSDGGLRSASAGAPANTEDLAAIAQRLRSTVVVYWPSDDAVFIWVVRRDGRIAAKRVDISRGRLVELIASTATDRAGRQPWRQLYDALVEPVRGDLPRTRGALLTIIPHGVLGNVSFAALPARDGRYLLEDYAIHYAPAGAVLQATAGMRRSDARTGAALLVADPAAVRRSPLEPPLPPLPGARQEIARIADLIPRRRLTRLQGADATESRVTAAAPGKTIVHFATHAIVRDEAPNESYLAFSPETGAANGLLTAREVYGLRLNADLVVLSACRSGGGRVTGDGVATFARAFFYAGTPSLVLSLWDVADAPSSRLLPAFYRTWLGGVSKARSLRRAQLQLLADLRAGTVRVETRAGPIVVPEEPRFWAGFVLIGEPE